MGGFWTRERIQRRVLELPTRRQIYEHIRDTPGVHLRRICRDLEMGVGNVEHHLHQLEKHDLIVSHKADKRKTFYVAGQVAEADRRWIHVLRKARPRRIVRGVLAHPEANTAELARRLDIERSTVSYHLNRLRERGLIERIVVGREHLHQVSDEERVRRLLDLQEPGGPLEVFAALLERIPETDGGEAATPPARTHLTVERRP